MTKTKTNTAKDKTKLKQPTPTQGLLTKTKFSKPLLIVFILIFATIGGYAIYRSFAAGNPVVYVSTTGNDSTCVRGDNTKPCATFQKAYNLSQCGDTILVEPGTYTHQQLIANGSSCTANVTFQPDSGVVTINSSMNASDSEPYDALALGDHTKCYNCGLDPPNHVTFDGGPSKNFHFGTAGVQGSGGKGGKLKVYAAYGNPPNQLVAADHIVLTNLSICNGCPDNGGDATLMLNSITNSQITNNVIGPNCCGVDLSGNSSGSPTLIALGPRVGFPPASGNLIEGNQFLGETRCGTVDPSKNCPAGQGNWPTSVLGPAPQPTCDEDCHDDCVHSSGESGDSYIDNIFYNCMSQGLYLEGSAGDFNNMTIVGNYIDSLGSCGLCSNVESTRGHWTIAFNTVHPGIGFADTPTPGNGVYFYTTTTSSFTQPAVSSSITVPVVDTSAQGSNEGGFQTNMYIAIGDANNTGIYKITAVTPTNLTLTNIGTQQYNGSPGATFSSGATVEPEWWPGASVSIVGNIGGAANGGAFTGNGSGCGEWNGYAMSYSYNYITRANANDDAQHGCGTGDVGQGAPDWLWYCNILVHCGDWNSIPSDNSTNFDLNTAQVGNKALGLVPASVCDQYTTADLHGTTRPSSGVCDAGAFQTASAGGGSGSVPGDADGDGHVGSSDLVALLASWHSTTSLNADFNKDGIIDLPDLSILLSHYGT